MSSIKGKSETDKRRDPDKNVFAHVVRENGGWAVKKLGDAKGVFSTQADAISAARKMAKKTAGVVVHNKLGKIQKISDSPTDARMMEVWKSVHKAAVKKK
jgi:hypothetical protein